MAAAYGQSDLVQAGDVTTVAVTFSATPTAGNHIVTFVGWWAGGGGAFSSVADNRSNTYTQIGSVVSNGNARVHGAYAENILTGSPHTVTWTFTAGSYPVGVVAESTGVATTGSLGASNSGNGNSTSGSSGAASPSTAGIYYAFITGTDETSGTFGMTPTWSGSTQDEEAEAQATSSPANLLHKVSSGSETATWTLSPGGNWCAKIAAFIEAGGAPAGHPAMRRHGLISPVGFSRPTELGREGGRIF